MSDVLAWKRIPSGAKAPIHFGGLMYGLKPVPFSPIHRIYVHTKARTLQAERLRINGVHSPGPGICGNLDG